MYCKLQTEPFLLKFDLQALHLGLDSKQKIKKFSVTCSTDQQVEGSKILILSLGLNRRGKFQLKQKTFECTVPFSKIGPAKLTNHGACTN